MNIVKLRVIFTLVLLAATLLPLYNGLYLYPSFSGLLVANTEDEARRLAGHLRTHLLGTMPPGGDPEAILRDKAADPVVLAMIGTTVLDFGLYKLRLFAASGETLYSTDPKEVGEFNRKDYFRQVVAKGLIFSQLVHKEQLSAEGKVIPRDVMEVYVPVRVGSRFVGALEIYYDISARSNRLAGLIGPNSLLLAVVWLISLALVVLFFKTHSSLLRAKLQLKEANSGLELRVAEAVEKSRRQEQLLLLQSRHAAMGEMIGAIAHQWRQPLNALAVIIQDIDDTHKHNELSREYFENAVASALRQIRFMSQTIDDFRNFYRPTSEKSVFDLVAALGETLSLLSASLKSSGVFWRVRCLEASCAEENVEQLKVCQPHLVYGFKNEFEQALINLINNARDATAATAEEGGEERLRQGRILFELGRDGGQALLRISDNGGGIAPEVLPRIFDPYFSTKEQGKGTGIGLYMTRVIIEDRMEGRIEAANCEEGAVFTIRLQEH